MKIRLLAICLLLLAALAGPALAEEPVIWSAKLEPADIRAGEGGRIVLSAKIEAPWHMYSTTMKEGGPFVTRIQLATGKALTAAGKLVQPAPEKVQDKNFNMEAEIFEGAVAFGIPVKVPPGASGDQKAVVKVEYQVCTEKQCLPPKKVDVPLSFMVAAGAARADRQQPDTTVPPQPPGAKAVSAGAAAPPDQPTAAAAGAVDENDRRVREAQNAGLLSFLWLSVTMGLLALLTPCVFPMVPITVSFFSKQKGSRREGITAAVAYCLGIIGTFTALGLLLAALFGATGIQKFAANPYVNIGLALLFIALAINLFGVFEITLPASLVNVTHPGKGHGRFVAPLLMGLTFTLTSFTCTVPFVGTLLVATSQGNLLWPIVGMLGFSTAFALPFFLLALFPQWLARLPKSGPWLVSVKATMGFLELAAALKFLSNADLFWNLQLLTRPVFLAIWSTIGFIAGLYLLGWMKLPHDAGPTRIGTFRRLLGVAMAGLGVWFLGAMSGRDIGELGAFLPPRTYGGVGYQRATQWVKDYDAAIALATATKKPLFVNFTGAT